MENKRNSPTPPLYHSETEKADDIINNGELYQRLALSLRNDEKPFLTDEQSKRLFLSFKTPKEKKALKNARYIFMGAVKYGRHLYTLQKLYQAEAEALATLCTKWEGYDNQAKTIDKFLDRFFIAPRTEEERNKFADPRHSKQDLEQALDFFFNFSEEDEEGNNKPIREGVVFRARQEGTDPEGKPIYKTYADIYGEDGLYKKIEERKDKATDYLQYLKAGMEQFSDFLTSKGVRESIGLRIKDKINPYSIILPRTLESVMDYPDYITFMDEEGSEKYFSFKLKERKDKGEKITPEEERRAVIPDYNQVEATEKYLAIEEDWMESYFSIFML